MGREKKNPQQIQSVNIPILNIDSSLVPSHKALPSYHNLLTPVPADLFSSYFSLFSLPGETEKKKKKKLTLLTQINFLSLVLLRIIVF